MPRFTGPLNSKSTSPGAHIRALWEALILLEDSVAPGKRARVRTTRVMLERAYPEFLAVNESDLMQWLAEEDGDAVSEST